LSVEERVAQLERVLFRLLTVTPMPAAERFALLELLGPHPDQKPGEP
jgi:hypothetical protein